MRQYISGLCTTTALVVVIPLGLVSNSSAVFAQTATPTATPRPMTTPNMGEGQRPPRPPRQRPSNPPATNGQAPTDSSPNNQNRPPRPPRTVDGTGDGQRPPRMGDGMGNDQRPPRPHRQRSGDGQNPPNHSPANQENQPPLTPPANTPPS